MTTYIKTLFCLFCVFVLANLVACKSILDAETGSHIGNSNQAHLLDAIGESDRKLSRKRRNARQHREFVWRTRVIPYEISYRLKRHQDVILQSIKEIQLFFKRWKDILEDWGPNNHSGLSLFTKVNEINFEKFDNHEVDLLGIQYDLKSVMHYGNYAFSRNVKQTLRAIKDKTISLGNENGLSALDVVKINALYDCSNKVSTSRNYMSAWSEWSACNNNCYKQRQRFCMASEMGKCKKVNKHGVETQSLICSTVECFAPVDGHWGRWSAWSPCSVTCGQGTRSRKRRCTDPVPKHGGKQCQGRNVGTAVCLKRQCNLGPLDCDFESGSCQWYNEPTNSLFYWQRKSGETPSRFTGPKSDHTTGKGFYLYTESSFPASKKMVARFSSPQFHPHVANEEKCMTVFINLNGAKIGTLSVKQRFVDNNFERTLWQTIGSMGTEWIRVQLDITGSKSYKIIFEAVHPGGYLSDFAIDDLSFRDGSCKRNTEGTLKRGICAGGEKALGLEEGLINDRRMMATSMKTLRYRPEFARLNNNSAWCVDPNVLPTRHYLKVDLGRAMNVVSIATQGFRNLNSWVNKYRLFYKKDGGKWTAMDIDGKAKVFTGNSDAHSIVKNKFPQPVVARYIGINPLSWSDTKDVCLRLELYGCSVEADRNNVRR
eukprot:gene4421-5011_t